MLGLTGRGGEQAGSLPSGRAVPTAYRNPGGAPKVPSSAPLLSSPALIMRPHPSAFLRFEKSFFGRALTGSQEQGVFGGGGLTQGWHLSTQPSTYRHNLACSSSSPPQLHSARALPAWMIGGGNKCAHSLSLNKDLHQTTCSTRCHRSQRFTHTLISMTSDRTSSARSYHQWGEQLNSRYSTYTSSTTWVTE